MHMFTPHSACRWTVTMKRANEFGTKKDCDIR